MGINFEDILLEFHRDDDAPKRDKKIRYFSLWYHILEKLSKSEDLDDLDEIYDDLLKNATSFEEVDAIDYFYDRVRKEFEVRFGANPDDVRNMVTKFIREYANK